MTSGRKTGVSRIIAEEVSMKIPAIRMITPMMNMMMYLFWDTESTPFAIVSGMFQFASTQPNAPEQAIMIMMTADVFADPFTISYSFFGPRSR